MWGGRTILAKVCVAPAMLLALLLALACPAIGAGRFALVVANSDYKGAPLSNPQVDLDLVAPALREMGFVVEQVANADLETFDLALNEFAENAKDAEIALFYFAGHGFALNDGISISSFLMSTDADVTSPSDRVIQAGGIRLDSIVQQLTSVARTTLIFVDACRNDPRIGRAGGGGLGRGFAAISNVAQGDVFVGLSTRLGKIAADGEPGAGSPFAHAFVEHIGEPGLNVPFAFNKVRLAVERSTGGIQSPELARSDLSDPQGLVLRAASAEVDRSRLKEAARLWDSIKDTTSVAMLEKFARDYDSTVYAEFAEVRLGELQSKVAAVSPIDPPVDAGEDENEDTQAIDKGLADIEGDDIEQPQTPDRLAVYRGLDFFGGDIANRREFDMVQCARACMQNGQCHAFTFNTRTRSGPNCFLKDSVGRLEAYDGALAGLLLPAGSPDPEPYSFPAIDPTQDVLRNTDIPFNDLSQTPWPGAATQADCRAACIDNDSCQAFSFVTSRRQCWLKHTVGNSQTRNGVVTGIKRWVTFETTQILSLD